MSKRRTIQSFSVFALIILLFLLIAFAQENYSTYTEVDPNNHITYTSTAITHVMKRNEDAYLYKNYGTGYFGTSFTHYLDCKFDSTSSNSDGVGWMLSNYVDDMYGQYTAHRYFVEIQLLADSSANPWIYLREYDGTNWHSSAQVVSKTTWYYLKIVRDGTSLTCYIYSDSARTNLLWTLAITMTSGTQAFQYVYACNTSNSGNDITQTVELANLNIGIAVTIGSFQAPSTAYAKQYFYLNATISDNQGSSHIVNATVELTGSIILKWIYSTNTFSIHQDTNGYCVIDASGCIKTDVDSYTIKLSWKIYLHWNCTEGYKSIVVTNTYVWDDSGHYGQGSQSNLFYFEDDLIINSASLTTDPDRVDPNSSQTITTIIYYQGTATAPYGVNGWTVYLKLNGDTKASATSCLSNGTVYLDFTAEATTNSYSYLIYTITYDGDGSVQNKTVAVIVDRVKVAFSVDDNDVWNGTTVNFTTTFQSEYDDSFLAGCYYTVKRNGTIWQNNICSNFTDVQNTPWTTYVYNFYQMNTNNWNLTQIVSMPSDITVLWYGYGAAAPPSAPVSSGGMLLIGLTFGLIFSLIFIGARLKARKPEPSNEQVFYSLSYRIRKVTNT
jgi:hypothetical protein